jgi:subtilisin
MRRIVTTACALLVLAAFAAPSIAGDQQVIVGFKGDPDTSLVTKHGGKADLVLTGLKAIRAHVPAKAVASLRAESVVAYVEEDAVLQMCGKPSSPPGLDKDKDEQEDPPPQVTPWGITRVGAPAAHALYTGEGIKVGVIDTGCDLDHPDLKANIVASRNFLNTRKSGDDDNGHGSHVAGTIAALDNDRGVIGVAPKASIYALKALDRKGLGWSSDIAAAIDWAWDEYEVHIVNMSFSSSANSSLISAACGRAVSGGVLLIAAAGNSGDGNTSDTEAHYPAALTNVVAVGATDSDDDVAYFSCSGAHLEVSGPGVGVLSTVKGGQYDTFDGTSMACPHAVGVAALLWDSLGSTNATAVRTALATSADDSMFSGEHHWGYGYGIVQAPTD